MAETLGRTEYGDQAPDLLHSSDSRRRGIWRLGKWLYVIATLPSVRNASKLASLETFGPTTRDQRLSSRVSLKAAILVDGSALVVGWWDGRGLPGGSAARLAAANVPLQSYFITGYGDGTMSVQAMKGGVEFLTSRLREKECLQLRQALARDKRGPPEQAELASIGNDPRN